MMPILAPASRNGSEFGSSIFQKTCSRLARNVRVSDRLMTVRKGQAKRHGEAAPTLLWSSVVRVRLDFDAKLLNHGDKHGVLIFEVAQDRLDLPLSPDIHLQIVLGTHFPMTALQILTDHDQRHEQNLNDVRNEQPEHESHRRIELPRWRCQQVPA